MIIDTDNFFVASLRTFFTGGAGGLPMQAGLGLSSSVEHNPGQDNDPISKLIKQLHQEKQQQQHNLVIHLLLLSINFLLIMN